jgi:histidyl-tRNA synthetase
LIESLGGSATAGVGWAAGIERLAMLIAEPAVEQLDVVIAVEDDRALATAFRGLRLFRDHGFATDMVATGSPRKRFDKANKMGAKVLVGIKLDGDTPTISTRAAPGVAEHDTVKELTLQLGSA